MTRGKDVTSVTHFIKSLPGGSQPILVRADDGLLYVAKFTNNLQGQNLPFNEGVGTELYRALHLKVPKWKPLLLTVEFLDKNPGCWLQTPGGSLRPASGLCFGSRFLGEDNKRLLEILPGNRFRRISNRGDFWLAWLIDICAGHADNRQAIFLESKRGQDRAYFVDHGHMFCGPRGQDRPHFMASRHLDPRIYFGVSSRYLVAMQRAAMGLNLERLMDYMHALPDEWMVASAVDEFSRCLNRLSDARLLENVVETMVSALRRGPAFEPADTNNERRPATERLRPGVQAA